MSLINLASFSQMKAKEAVALNQPILPFIAGFKFVEEETNVKRAKIEEVTESSESLKTLGSLLGNETSELESVQSKKSTHPYPIFGEPTPFTSSSTQKPSPPTTLTPTTIKVVIRDMQFVPSKIRIRQGTMVEWVIEATSTNSSRLQREGVKHIIGFDEDQSDLES